MQRVEEVERRGRLLAIGDIHGCLFELQDLLDQVNPQTEDRIVFLGDYVDRGPDSAGVISFLLALRDLFPQTVYLRGNHEQMFLDFLSGADPSLFLLNGGTETLNSYQNERLWPIPEAHRMFLETLDYSFETDDFIFAHAGLRPGLPLSEQSLEDLLWIRQDFLKSEYDWGKTVVFGHTPLKAPYQKNNRIGLDTGCVYGRSLTCCDVKNGQLWQTHLDAKSSGQRRNISPG
ncbi:MAG: serine/threonine protein phosphatase [Deltaproteobacteria bacterium]|nr:serine/threonine protein phosphatase [Deltaproteobacteria bacterium]